MNYFDKSLFRLKFCQECIGDFYSVPITLFKVYDPISVKGQYLKKSIGLPLNEIKVAARTNHHNHKGLCKGQMIPEVLFIFFADLTLQRLLGIRSKATAIFLYTTQRKALWSRTKEKTEATLLSKRRATSTANCRGKRRLSATNTTTRSELAETLLPALGKKQEEREAKKDAYHLSSHL